MTTTLMASTYNPTFLIASGGTPAPAEAALFAGIMDGYLSPMTVSAQVNSGMSSAIGRPAASHGPGRLR